MLTPLLFIRKFTVGIAFSIAYTSSFAAAAEFPGSVKISRNAPAGTTVPDPGAQGKQTVAGIDINNNQVRDDVEVFIGTLAPSSAKHREALKSYAAGVQRELLSTTRAEAIQAAIDEVRAIECLEFINKRDEKKWEEVLALMLNTSQRRQALANFNRLVTGSVFHALPDSQLRTACNFRAESLPN